MNTPSTKTTPPPFPTVYRVESIAISGHTFKYSDQGYLIEFPESEAYHAVYFSPTQYAIMKHLLFRLNEIVLFSELISTYHPTSGERRQERRDLSKHICILRRLLPNSVIIHTEYNVGYLLLLLS